MSSHQFRTDARIDTPHGFACRCAVHARRTFTALIVGAAALPTLAQQQRPVDEGVRKDVGRESRVVKYVPAEEVEGAAQQQYAQLLQKAQQERALAPANHPQVERLRFIAERLIPAANTWNERAPKWKWEVNLLGDQQINAFCMPGGKIAFFYGILQQLQLNDDEVAAIMGHEMAHAVREHARERVAKTMATRGVVELGSALLGLGNAGRMVAGGLGNLLSLRFGREDESEADIVGMELAARGGYDPRAGVTLWQKMLAASKGAPPQFMSTHPSGKTRIKDIEGKLAKVQPIYARAGKPERKFAPPEKAAAK
jgi:predicted Zn-dependent protease